MTDFFVGVRGDDGKAEVHLVRRGATKRMGLWLHAASHSPDGFEWGYQGSGPAQLALAIMCVVTNDPAAALPLYQRFKRQIVAELPFTGWVLSFPFVHSWIMAQLASQASKDAIDLGLCMEVE